MSVADLRLHQPAVAVLLPQGRLFDLPGGVARHTVKDDPAGPLVAGQIGAELGNLRLCAVLALLHLNDCRGNLAQTGVGQADDRHILDLIVLAQEILDLDWVEVLPAGDDDVLLAVHQENEAVPMSPV